MSKRRTIKTKRQKFGLQKFGLKQTKSYMKTKAEIDGKKVKKQTEVYGLMLIFLTFFSFEITELGRIQKSSP